MDKQWTQTKIERKVRIVAEIDPQVARLARSLAALQGRRINEVVETLLREWISNKGDR